ncbi:hypothetical protein [Halobacillus litoralis]|nr:hypothetical protein [Halobacillus litoralis]MCA1022753.1 hypothetical protein [Halobacillus litoralis]
MVTPAGTAESVPAAGILRQAIPENQQPPLPTSLDRKESTPQGMDVLD